VSAKSAKEKEKLAEAKEKQKALQAEAKQLMEKLAASEGKVTALSAELETKKKAEERVSAERRAAEAEVEKVSGKAMSLEAKVAAAREAAARAAEEAGVRVAEMEARLAENDKRTKAAIADQAAARLEAQQAVCCGSGRGHHDCLGWPLMTSMRHHDCLGWPLMTSDCAPHQATALEEGTRRSQEVVTRAEKRASVAEAAEHATRIEVKMHQVQCRQSRDDLCEGRGGCMHVLITAPLTLFPTGTRRQSRGGACEGRGGAADFSTSRLPRRAPTCPRGFRAEGRRCAGGGGGGDGGGGGG
jgi:hypothetical protein